MNKEEKKKQLEEYIKEIKILINKIEKIGSLPESKNKKVNKNRRLKIFILTKKIFSLFSQYHKIILQPIFESGSEFVPIGNILQPEEEKIINK